MVATFQLRVNGWFTPLPFLPSQAGSGPCSPSADVSFLSTASSQT